ncbi:UDP-glucose 4-epimerase GalE [Trueperella bialowiezensis]|uniref:UDP-glucose 4-epimerase n=1 Tax=Trueperella bialowiezensis TaxID=312285 RepID=A0A3S4YZF7_9ACTO|nr:UDP-glucose 4-epimerase GalE [Trueperella bialowiezensis]VEI14144.1 UDP-glucose 4-epimerase [Trueperella bialowiezensis]
MKVLVAGGAGYIGSHTVVELVAAGHEPIVVDNFSNSQETVIDRLEEITGTDIRWYKADLTDADLTRQIFDKERPDAVIHFAGLKAVGESVDKPLEYYENNLMTTFAITRGMIASGCSTIVFSSSATVYGDADLPLTEDVEHLDSLSPYGYTKVASERILTDFSHAYGFRLALLRYFNPVGAHQSGKIGENPLGRPNNLMPSVAQVATGRLDKLLIFGDDYPTRDGSAVRDYLHVVDLARAHVVALDKLPNFEERVKIWNLGTGTGTSVFELVDAFEQACGFEINKEVAPRRAGDRAEVYAAPDLARTELGWEAEFSIADMCADTWRWQQANPNGYPDGAAASRPETL